MKFDFEENIIGKTVKQKKDFRKWVKNRDAKGRFVFLRKEQSLDFNFISEFRSILIGLKKFMPNQQVKVWLQLPYLKLVDKLSLTLLECVIFSFQNKTGSTVYVNYIIKNFNTATNDIQYSPIKYLSINNYSKKSFDSSFNGISSVNSHTHRCIVTRRENNDNPYYLSKVNGDVSSFVSMYLNSGDLIDTLSELISELVGNATTHGNADCLYEISITSPSFTMKNKATAKKYFGVNINVLNFSDIPFSLGVKEKILSLNNKKVDGRYSDRYLGVQKAYEYHSNYFNTKYKEEDFWNLATLQDHISGRKGNLGTGGAGMEKLLNSIQKAAEIDNCYILTGGRVTYLHKNLLDYDEWLGMNEEQKFIDGIPNEVFTDAPLKISGTGINLNFIFAQD